MTKSLSFFCSALFFVGSLIIQGCSQSPSKAVNPAESDEWRKITHIKGHKGQFSDRFETKGQPLMITYHAEATGDYTHCNFELGIVEGIEEMYDSPIISSLNRDKISGKEMIQPEGQSYYLRLKVLEMHYDIKVYRKKAPDPTKVT